jgi:hypothetical protein
LNENHVVQGLYAIAIFVYHFEYRMYCGFRPAGRGTFLCFAKEKYPKERRPRRLAREVICDEFAGSLRFSPVWDRYYKPAAQACSSGFAAPSG